MSILFAFSLLRFFAFAPLCQSLLHSFASSSLAATLFVSHWCFSCFASSALCFFSSSFALVVQAHQCKEAKESKKLKKQSKRHTSASPKNWKKASSCVKLRHQRHFCFRIAFFAPLHALLWFRGRAHRLRRRSEGYAEALRLLRIGASLPKASARGAKAMPSAASPKAKERTDALAFGEETKGAEPKKKRRVKVKNWRSKEANDAKKQQQRKKMQRSSR